MIQSLVCTAWFDLARNPLPKPLCAPLFSQYRYTYGVRGTKRKRDVTDIGKPADTQQVHLKLRMERKRLKNVRVHFTEWPEAPGPRNGRSLSPVSQWPETYPLDPTIDNLEHLEDLHRSAPTKFLPTNNPGQMLNSGSATIASYP